MKSFWLWEAFHLHMFRLWPKLAGTSSNLTVWKSSKFLLLWALFLISGIKDPHFTASNLFTHLTYKKQTLAKNPSAITEETFPLSWWIFRFKLSSRRRWWWSLISVSTDSLSDPRFSVVSTDGGEVSVECEALCWKPAPLVTILDDEGKRLTDELAKQEQDPRGCYNTKQNVKLLKPVSRWVTFTVSSCFWWCLNKLTDKFRCFGGWGSFLCQPLEGADAPPVIDVSLVSRMKDFYIIIRPALFHFSN